jgi:hypothetical protein
MYFLFPVSGSFPSGLTKPSIQYMNPATIATVRDNDFPVTKITIPPSNLGNLSLLVIVVNEETVEDTRVSVVHGGYQLPLQSYYVRLLNCDTLFRACKMKIIKIKYNGCDCGNLVIHKPSGY